MEKINDIHGFEKAVRKSVFKNNNATVSVIFIRDGLIAHQNRRYIEDMFGGSLPRFIASFFGGKKLSMEQTDGLRRFIKENEGSGGNR